MSSHFSVPTPGKLGVRLRELDDSRRGARFSNRKEDVLLERKLSYLNNQRKRTQISINREKEFIKSRKDMQTKDMNHLDRRYREAMGFILDYKAGQGFEPPLHHITTISSVKTDTMKWKRGSKGRIKSGESSSTTSSKKCAFDTIDDKSVLSFARTKSAPAKRSLQYSSGSDLSASSKQTLSRGLSKLSLETPTESSSDNESEVGDLFIRRTVPPTLPRPSTSHAPSTADNLTLDNKRFPRSLHRMNTSNKTDFWTVLRQTRNTEVGGHPLGFDIEEHPEQSKKRVPRELFRSKTKEIIDTERVLALFSKVDKMKDNTLPSLI